MKQGRRAATEADQHSYSETDDVEQEMEEKDSNTRQVGGIFHT